MGMHAAAENVRGVLEMTETPENSHIGIRAFSLRKCGGVNSSGSKQDELEAIVHQEVCDIVAIMEM